MALIFLIITDPRSMLIQKASVYLAIDILPINIDQGPVLVARRRSSSKAYEWTLPMVTPRPRI